MNFDLTWFTTMPGLLITGGVLLLIIALILLIVSGKKQKKEKDLKELTNENSGQNAMPASTQVPVVDPNAMTVPVGNIPMAPVDSATATVEGNVSTTIDPLTVAASVQPVTNSAMPEVTPAPVVEANPAPVMPEVTPAPVVEANPAPVMPEVTPASAVENANVGSAPVIYGGASPSVGNVSIDNGQNHQIYGGADPLENTQPIPGVSSVTPVAPVTPVMTTPVSPEIDQL